MPKRIILASLFVLLVTLTAFGAKPKSKPTKKLQKPLAGLVLVLDPGHGGVDPGSHGTFGKQAVDESDYAYDVAKRIAVLAKARGALVFQTTKDKKRDRYSNLPTNRVIPHSKDEHFVVNDKQVVAGSAGLKKRVEFANDILSRYQKHKVVFLAVHFDVLPEGQHGVHILVPEHYRPAIADHLLNSLGDIKAADPLKVCGQNVKHVYVLGSRNKIREKVLVEFGNFANASDSYRIRNYAVRNRYADRVVNGLEKFSKS